METGSTFYNGFYMEGIWEDFYCYPILYQIHPFKILENWNLMNYQVRETFQSIFCNIYELFIVLGMAHLFQSDYCTWTSFWDDHTALFEISVSRSRNLLHCCYGQVIYAPYAMPRTTFVRVSKTFPATIINYYELKP